MENNGGKQKEQEKHEEGKDRRDCVRNGDEGELRIKRELH